MNLDEIVTLTRDLIREANPGHWQNADLVRKINATLDTITSKLISMSTARWVRRSNFSAVSAQDVYALPTMAARIHRIERIDGTYPVVVTPITLSDAYRWTSPLTGQMRREAYAVEGNDIYIFPTPTSSITDAYRIWFIRRHPYLHTGTAAAGAAGSITFDATPTLGILVALTDSYAGLEVELTGGTGSGQRRTISAYVADTRVASVSANWTTPPDATSTYALIPDLPEQHHATLAYGAARDALVETRDNAKDLAALFDGRMEVLVGELCMRQEQQSRRVRYVDTEED